ncbi:hypothetical protein [Nostoc sp. LEGE 12450]|uniref:hypothetical protein n=1 Tax=Nostoc sp. LEGE 12450 TaxID=1828643 RepID=UPI001881470B|nr:hypothetical protein [Nostoc sp. LEGE 12450]MBE8988861.1 hypothetical protein [Nostoc sp. LEGE 12450]
MKNKIVAIVVALGSAIFAAPAHAQITGTPATVGVNVTVPEILYLRTVSTINVTLTPADLGVAGLTASGSGFYNTTPDQAGTADTTPASTLNTTSPFTTATAATKTINGVYVVWSNSPRAGGVDIAVAKPGGADPGNGTDVVPMTVAPASNITGATANGLINPVTGTGVGSVVLAFDASDVPAGNYNTGGQVTITAAAP